jgi:hypothetical protein
VSNEGVPTGDLPGRVIRGAQPLPPTEAERAAAAVASIAADLAKL